MRKLLANSGLRLLHSGRWAAELFLAPAVGKRPRFGLSLLALAFSGVCQMKCESSQSCHAST
ncbi:exported hypothetical protein [Verrucomicrobia bacterium]|nr:exported hypothetical protein [Verrucomicrobiota bacterium]